MKKAKVISRSSNHDFEEELTTFLNTEGIVIEQIFFTTDFAMTPEEREAFNNVLIIYETK